MVTQNNNPEQEVPEQEQPVEELDQETESENPEVPVAGQENGASPVAEAPPSPPSPPPNIPSNTDLQQQALLQQQAAMVQAENQRLQGEQARQALDKEYQDFHTQLEGQGYAPEQAAFATQRYQAIREEALQVQNQSYQQSQYLEGKMNAAIHYSEQYGVSAKELMQHNSPQAMEKAAKDIRRIKTLENTVSSMKQSGVPVQNFETGQSSSSRTSESKLLDSANNKSFAERTPEENAAMKRAAGL
jgi:hypothetical protein